MSNEQRAMSNEFCTHCFALIAHCYSFLYTGILLKLTNLKALVIVCNDSACPINRYPFGLRLSYRLAIICFFALSSKYIRTFLQNITSNPLIVLILTWS